MPVNIRNINCNGCKYAGVFLCTNSNKCLSNNLFTGTNNLNRGYYVSLPNVYKDFFNQCIFSLCSDGRYYLYAENDSIHEFILSFDDKGNYYSIPLKDFYTKDIVKSFTFMFKGCVQDNYVLDILNYDESFN